MNWWIHTLAPLFCLDKVPSISIKKQKKKKLLDKKNHPLRIERWTTENTAANIPGSTYHKHFSRTSKSIACLLY
jgi:hypothetical protein